MVSEKLNQDISHSIKSPLSSLHAQLSLLVYLKEKLPESLQDKVPGMLHHIETLSERINDLLTLTFPYEIAEKGIEKGEEVRLSLLLDSFTPSIPYTSIDDYSFLCNNPSLFNYILRNLHSLFLLFHPTHIQVAMKKDKKQIVIEYILKTQTTQIDKDTQAHIALKVENINTLLSSIKGELRNKNNTYIVSFPI